MAEEIRKPAPLPEVDASQAIEAAVQSGGEYTSSEQIQVRNARDVFLKDQQKNKKLALTEKDKVKALLDRHIDEHSNTKTVRDIAKKNVRKGNYQLDLSADIVEILEKIKSELR